MSVIPANLADLAIILVIVLSIWDGWRRGFLALLVDLVSLLLSILIALKYYLSLAPFIGRLFEIPEHGAKVLSFFFIALAFGALFSITFRLSLRLLPARVVESLPDRLVGTVFGGIKGVVYVAILLLLLTSLPVLQPVKNQIAGSRYGPPIVQQAKVTAAKAEGYLKGKFGGLLEDTFALLTIKPGESGIELGFTTTKVTVDERAETEMLRLLNQERTSRGLEPLTMDPTVREVARAHSRDMFARGYFSHVTPDGIEPAERLTRAGIEYTVMGENLALAPTVELAHKGLMNSPSHRENMLFPDYRKIGIGAINGGIYGIMFSQEFTD